MIIGHHDGARTLDGAHDAGNARSGANFEDIFVSDELIGSFLDIMRAGPAGIPQQVTLQPLSCQRLFVVPFKRSWAVPYIKRMAAHESHAYYLPGQHAVLGKGGLLLLWVEPLRVLEHVTRVEIIFGHGGL